MTKLPFSLATALLFAAGAMNAQSYGTIVGLVRDSATIPIAGATMIAAKADGGAIRSTISASDGVYSFPDLAPGAYTVKAKAAGHLDFTAPSLQVIAGDATRADITMPPASKADSAPTTISSLTPATPATPPATSARPTLSPVTPAPVVIAGNTVPAPSAGTNVATGNFWRRLVKAAEKSSAAQDQKERATTASVGAPPASAFDKPLALPAAAIPGPGPAQAPQEAAAAAATPPVDLLTPFADSDWSWLNGNSRQHDSPLDSKYLSGEFRADTFFGLDFNQPKDHSMGGSSEVFRSGEFQLEDLSLGGDFHAGNMRGRVLMLFGMFSATTVRNDSSPAVGQWDVRSAYKYVSEAYGGYHFNVQHGLNVDAGIFVSYVGLFGYHNFDNWAYQPSYVSSNTPWFFNGLRIQYFPTQHLKIEPWIINGWQSYNKFNGHLGYGGQIKWTPKPWLDIIGNQYAVGNDNIGLPHRGRYHTDDSIEVKYYDHQKAGNGVDKMAFTFTGDLGCETGQGVTCHGGQGPYDPITGKGGPKQSFVGWMAYNRWWWHKDVYAFTLGGGQMNNPGRYLTLVLPVNGADAISGTPYFPSGPGLPLKAYDGTATLDWMPSQFVTFRTEFGYRHTNVPYWSGRGGITPPGGNNGAPAQYACNDGSASGSTTLVPGLCSANGGVWFPDLRKGQALLSFSIMVKL